MATINWTTGYGVWNAGTNWAGGLVPGPGDTAVINISGAEPDFTAGGSLSGVTVQIVAGFKFDIAGSLAPTTLDATSTIALDNSAAFTIADAGIFRNNGVIGYGGGSGETDWYLIPGGGVTSALNNNGTINLSAPFKLMGFGDFENSGLLQIRNVTGLPNVGFTVLSSTQALINSGTVVIDGHDATTRSDTSATFASLYGAGEVDLSYGTLTFKGDVGTSGTRPAINFRDGLGTMNLDLAGHVFQGVISGFQAGDTIDLGLISADTVAFAPGGVGTPGTLTVSSGTATVATLLMDGAYQATDFGLALNGLSHEILTTTAAPCFAGGTRLLTATGEVAVEDLAVGDRLPTRLGAGIARVKWIGHREVNCRRHPRPWDVWPVRVMAGAFAPGAPLRDLWLSPDHAVHAAGMLVPVRYLINGATIAQVPRDRVTYWHVELEAHDVVLAEGLPVETYLDTGNRASFANADGAVAMAPEFARGAWAASGCAPLVTEGPAVAETRKALVARAAALGFGLTGEAGLRLEVDGRVVVDGVLPEGARRAVLVSRAAVPAEVDAGPDGRRLGVAVVSVRLDGEAVALDDARLGAGWHAAESGWRWTDGHGAIDVTGARRLEVRLANLPMRYWDTGRMGARDQAGAGG